MQLALYIYITHTFIYKVLICYILHIRIRYTCIVYPNNNYYHDRKHRTITQSEVFVSQAWLTTYVRGQNKQYIENQCEVTDSKVIGLSNDMNGYFTQL